MADSETKPKGVIDSLINTPLVKPESDDGIGPTLGEDLSPEYERAQDAKAGAHDLPDADDDDDRAL